MEERKEQWKNYEMVMGFCRPLFKALFKSLLDIFVCQFENNKLHLIISCGFVQGGMSNFQQEL